MYGNQFYNQPQYTQRFQQMEMPIQQYLPNVQNTQTTLLGKTVDSIDVVRAMDIPLDGTTSYFPLMDGSAIVTKQLQKDGTSKIMIFKPVTNEEEKVKYVTMEDIDELKSEIKSLKKEIKELKSFAEED